MQSFARVVASLLEEIEPIVKHGLAAGIAVLVSAGLIRLLTTVLPKETAGDLLTIDHYLAVVVFVLFSTNTAALLAIRLFRNLRHEISRAPEVEKS